jgi:hypothetical protein
LGWKWKISGSNRPKGAIDAAYHGTNESNYTTKARVRNQPVSQDRIARGAPKSKEKKNVRDSNKWSAFWYLEEGEQEKRTSKQTRGKKG